MSNGKPYSVRAADAALSTASMTMKASIASCTSGERRRSRNSATTASGHAGSANQTSAFA